MRINILETDKIELANYLDTEAFIGIVHTHERGRSRFIPMMIVSNTSKAWLDEIKAKWSGALSEAGNHKQDTTHKRCWQWHIHGQDLLMILDAVHPYLKIKGGACELTRELQYRISKQIGRDEFNRLTPQEREIRTDLHRRCKLLTCRGFKD